MTQGPVRLLAGVLFCAVAGTCQPASAKDAAAPPTAAHPRPLRDYFFYRCMHEYFQGTELDEKDASVSYMLGFLPRESRTVDRLIRKAKATAAAVKASHPREDQVAEGTYGKTPILAICLEESRMFKIPGKMAKK